MVIHQVCFLQCILVILTPSLLLATAALTQDVCAHSVYLPTAKQTITNT